MEDADQDSPLYRIVDTSTLALVRHSFGGVIGLFALAPEVCLGSVVPPFLLPCCEGQYQRPAAFRATAFYGTSLVQSGSLLLDLDTTGVATTLLRERSMVSHCQETPLSPIQRLSSHGRSSRLTAPIITASPTRTILLGLFPIRSHPR
jgi:hypothetical protein